MIILRDKLFAAIVKKAGKAAKELTNLAAKDRKEFEKIAKEIAKRGKKGIGNAEAEEIAFKALAKKDKAAKELAKEASKLKKPATSMTKKEIEKLEKEAEELLIEGGEAIR